MLQNLTPELLLMVVELITSRSDLRCLSEVSKTLYEVTVPRLYENIIIWSRNENRLEELDVAAFSVNGYSNPGSRLRYVKGVQVLSKFRSRIMKRCIHDRSLDVDEDLDHMGNGVDSYAEEVKASKDFAALADTLMPIFRDMKDGRLRNFCWKLGTCVPLEILGPSGFLPDQQNLLESLSITTGGSCYLNLDGERAIDLSIFHSLQDFSWTGLRFSEEFKSLGKLLDNNAAHLVKLHLDLVQWSNAADFNWGDDDNARDFSIKNILKLTGSKSHVKFSNLENLSLSALSFENAALKMVHALNFSCLRSLTLRRCPFAEDFLLCIIASKQKIRLKSLEIQIAVVDNIFAARTIAGLILKFKGLEDIFMSFPGQIPHPISFLSSMARHRASVKRFVCQQMLENLNFESWHFGEEYDLTDMSMCEADITELDVYPSRHPFLDLDLECLGLCCGTHLLRSLLLPFTKKWCLKLLHIRRSGTDMAQIPCETMWAKWDGNPSASTSEHTLSPCDVCPKNDVASNSDPSNNHSACSTSNPYSDEYSLIPFEILTFANWAFGPHGVPSLQVLAYGDFSYDGRFSQYNTLMCPGTGWSTPAQQPTGELGWTFRRLKKSDKVLWDLVNENADFLGACPTDLILSD